MGPLHVAVVFAARSLDTERKCARTTRNRRAGKPADDGCVPKVKSRRSILDAGLGRGPATTGSCDRCSRHASRQRDGLFCVCRRVPTRLRSERRPFSVYGEYPGCRGTRFRSRAPQGQCWAAAPPLGIPDSTAGEESSIGPKGNATRRALQVWSCAHRIRCLQPVVGPRFGPIP